MSAFKKDVPNYAGNSPSDYFNFPKWKYWMEYQRGMVVSGEVKNPLSRDSDYTVPLAGTPATTVTTTEKVYLVDLGFPPGFTISTEVDFILPNVSSTGITLTWDSDTQAWQNIPPDFSGVFTDTKITHRTVSLGSPTLTENWPKPVDKLFISSLQYNTAILTPEDRITNLLARHNFAFNDGGLFDVYGDGTSAWVFVVGGVVSFADKGKQYNNTHHVYTTNNTKIDIINAALLTVISNVTLYSIMGPRYIDHKNNIYRARWAGQGQYLTWDTTTERFTNIRKFYFDGAILAPNGDYHFYVDGSYMGNSTSNPLYVPLVERTDLPPVLEVRDQNGTLLSSNFRLWDWKSNDTGVLTLADYRYSEFSVWDQRETWWYMYRNGVLLDAYLDEGTNKSTFQGLGSSTGYRPNFNNTAPNRITIETVDQNNNVINTFNNTPVYKISKYETVDYFIRTVTKTIPAAPGRNVTIRADDKLHSCWICLTPNENKNPADSENSEYWRLLYDFEYDSLVNELAGTLTYFGDSERLKYANVDYAEIIIEKADSDSEAVSKYMQIDSEYKILKSIYDSEIDYSGVIEKRIDSDLASKIRTDFSDEIIKQFDSDDIRRVLFEVLFYAALDSEKHYKDSDIALITLLRDISRSSYGADSEIMYAIINFPKQTLSQYFRDLLKQKSLEAVFNDIQYWIDSDSHQFDSERMFPLKSWGTALLDSEYLHDIDSDMRYYADSEFVTATSIAPDFNNKTLIGIPLRGGIAALRGSTLNTTSNSYNFGSDFADSEIARHGEVFVRRNIDGAYHYFQYVMLRGDSDEKYFFDKFNDSWDVEELVVSITKNLPRGQNQLDFNKNDLWAGRVWQRYTAMK